MKRIGAILAAGRSTRFGAEDKLLALYRGRPTVIWAAEALCEAGCEELIAIVSSPGVGAILPADYVVHHVPPGLPMSTSLRTALRVALLRKADGLLVCLGDMPNITSAVLRSLLAVSGSSACIQGGRRLPPAYIAAQEFDRALAAQDGDHGARQLISALPSDRLINISRYMAHDIDQPADLEEPR